jgi:FKBP-type peptidyl-prolyl cis-trans isomerase
MEDSIYLLPWPGIEDQEVMLRGERIMPKNELSKRLIFSAAMIAFLILSAQAFCQAPDGSLSGIVRDQQKKIVEGAIVTIKDKGTDIGRTRSTDSSGRYLFLGLEPGNYTVTVEVPGFVQRSQDCQISFGNQGVLDFLLEIKSPEPEPIAIPKNEYPNQDSIWKESPLKREEKLKIKKEGDAFLSEYQVKEDVMTIPPNSSGQRGVIYKVITKGNGPKPAETDTVEVNFILSLINGKELKEVSNTFKRGQTVSWQVGQIIPGMKTVLMNMPVGSTWEVVIPPEQAYGDKATGPIGPNSTLVFTVELKDIKK